MKKLKLKIELVPSTAFYKNLREVLKKEDWDTLRRESYRKAKYKCEICGGKGEKHPVECHEIWTYDDKKHIQKLEGLISLCPACHEVKHMGLAYIRNRGDIAKDHFKKINKLQDYEASKYIDKAFKKHKERSKYEWNLDLSFLEEANIKKKKI